MLQVKGLYGGYPGFRVLENVTFSAAPGELFGILGPNGSGKTTLLKMISGLLTPNKGEILINGKPLQNYSTKELAKITAVLPQVASEVFAYTVRETVSLGRYAHQRGLFGRTDSQDDLIIDEAMALTGVKIFQDKLLNELSGGERQRVFLAQALAQEPKVLLLDEPTNHLDLSFQKDLLDLLKKWTLEHELTVVSIFHDLNLASLYCDRLLLLKDGQISAIGKTDDVLEEERIREVYKTTLEVQPHPKVPKPQMILLPEEEEVSTIKIDESFLEITDDFAELISPFPLKVMAASANGAGIGWHSRFIMYFSDEFNEKESAVAMPATNPELVHFQTYEQTFILASVGRTQDVVNLCIFVNGNLSDEAYLQGIIAASEARALATGKSGSGGIVIASTQQGNPVEGEMLGNFIREGVREIVGKLKSNNDLV
ncbi:ATP-binding cassette domain-containing protein [Lederbergia wuyishanensis]|uniref:Iron complex transport system ATP-binding protein n=1 Tax=Lederbergia wuyishanensis TaxID=1347903 RepID=A0ABU0D3I7_9BACI|nr:ATP-binding cassette domain-containing protein [Lederbergia wuyishanensis]MCJ8007888.1 ATP-binding cassette domain-containing protein [Lederbergia wuyishanensis]MDQ0342945.1 iron complex transport system ATP-binding protein [Lederbergia wuyishanensis]